MLRCEDLKKSLENCPSRTVADGADDSITRSCDADCMFGEALRLLQAQIPSEWILWFWYVCFPRVVFSLPNILMPCMQRIISVLLSTTSLDAPHGFDWPAGSGRFLSTRVDGKSWLLLTDADGRWLLRNCVSQSEGDGMAREILLSYSLLNLPATVGTSMSCSFMHRGSAESLCQSI